MEINLFTFYWIVYVLNFILNVSNNFYFYTKSSGFVRGPGDDPKPIAFSFHDKFKQGPLLSVVSSHTLLSSL